MAKRWIVQEAFVYVSVIFLTEYLASMDSSMPRIWTDEEDPHMHSHVPSGKGKGMIMDRNL